MSFWLTGVNELDGIMDQLQVKATTTISFRSAVMEPKIMCEVETYPEPRIRGFGKTWVDAARDALKKARVLEVVK